MSVPGDGGVVLVGESPDAASTRSVGEAFGTDAPDGAVVLLSGPLGAGKTTFAQGVGRGCGVAGPVASPTYNLILHHLGERPFTHVDLYRLDSAAELATLDLDEILSGDGVTCVEWPETVAGEVVPPYAAVDLEPVGDDRRRMRARLVGRGWEAVRAGLEARGWSEPGEESSDPAGRPGDAGGESRDPGDRGEPGPGAARRPEAP